MTVPDSCCVNNSTCISGGGPGVDPQQLRGCSMTLVDFVQTQLVIVAAVGIAFLVGEVRH